MTEDEARTKWCPMSRKIFYSHEDDVSGTSANRYEDGDIQDTCMCVASNCMMWRKSGEIGKRPNGQIVKKDDWGDVKWIEEGYCGLAGKP